MLTSNFIIYHRSFSNFQYFDSKGMFISLVYSIPLLLNTVIIVVGFTAYSQACHIKCVTILCVSHRKHLFMCLCYTLTDGVGVQDLFHHDWAEDTPAQAKGPQSEQREDWLSADIISVHGLYWEELGIHVFPILILNLGAGVQIPSDECLKDCWTMSVRTGMTVERC